MAILTLIKLAKTRPNAIIAQNPPIFLPVTCWIYCLFAKCSLIIDHHCIWSEKAIHNPILKKIIAFFEKAMVKRVELNIAPHDVWTGKLQELGGEKAKVLTLIDYVEKISFKKIDRERFCKTKFLAVYPGGTGSKERPDLAIKAVEQLNEVTLVLTGKKEYLKQVLSHESNKIRFSGFLPNEEYFGLMKEADIIINTTDEPNTIPHFLYEATALHRPIISSPNAPIIQLFDLIYIIKQNTPEELKNAIKDVLENEEKWTQKIQQQHKKLKQIRTDQVRKLIMNLNSYLAATS
jgi:glycosyltransferase involved in cell wall biosynthesis